MRLSAIESFALLVSTLVAPELVLFPAAAVDISARQALWPILLSVAADGGMLLLLWAATAPLPRQDFAVWGPRLLGPWGVWLAKGAVALTFLGLTGVGLHTLMDILGQIFLTNTPEWFLALSMLAVVLYASFLDLRQVAFLAMLLLPALVGEVLFATGLSAVLVRHLRFVLPLGPVTLQQLGATWLGSLFVLSPSPALFLILRGHLARESRVTIRWALLLAFSLGFLHLLSLYVATIGTFGPYYLARLVWPVVALFRLVVLPGFLFSRLGFILITGWSGFLFLYMTVNLVAVVRVLDLRPLWLTRIGLLAAVYLVAVLVDGPLSTHYLTNQAYVSLLFSNILLPLWILAMWGIRRWKRQRKRQRAPQPQQG